MKFTYLLVFFTLLTIFSCSNQDVYFNYGSEINLDNEETFASSIRGNYNISNIEGQIIDVCPKKGCWMNVKVDKDTVFVKFKDYAFFVPTTGAEGKKVYMSGEIFRDSISVERLRHYAEDANKPESEILAIKTPKYMINMIANGVAIKEN